MALITSALLVFARIASAILVAPLLGHAKFPLIFRVGLAFMLTAVTVPLLLHNSAEPLSQTVGQFLGTQQLQHEPQPDTQATASAISVDSAVSVNSANSTVSANSASALFPSLLNEVLIGGAIGLGIMILLSAAQVAGQIVGQLAGINMTDPLVSEGSEGGVTAGFFNMLSLAVFALMGGPEMVVSAVLETFHELPLGSEISQSRLLEMLVVILGQSLSLAVRAVGPAIAALLIATIALGFLSRTIPQLNMLQVGLGSNLIVFWLAIFMTLGGCVWLFVDDITVAVDYVKDTLTLHNASAYGR